MKIKLFFAVLGMVYSFSLFAQQDADIPNKDQVIADDLIVQSSMAVGMDAVNGENFGYSTVILKENNLRIKFWDTSNSGSFPSNDWTLEANSSSNGGTNHFCIVDDNTSRRPFFVEAGAPNYALYVEDYGRIGFGTNTPVVELHTKDGDTPTLRLEQSGSSGWTPQTWDIAGNESNFFIRDVTNGSKLVFRIKPGAPSNSIYVDTDGDIGLGTQTPDGLFDIAHPSNANNHALLVDPVGNVGINIPNGETPNALLDIKSDTWSEVHLGSSNTNANPSIVFYRSKGTNSSPLSVADNDYLGSFFGRGYDGAAYKNAAGIRYRVDGNPAANSIPAEILFNTTTEGQSNFSTKMVIRASGNVGIGTTTPDEKLTVNGNIKCAELIVTSKGWPDFVFADNYQLKSLSEVESFIKENNHLPEVPSEKQIIEEGISVGEMNAILLQKIEELTLYMIDLKKENEEMKKQIENLENK